MMLNMEESLGGVGVKRPLSERMMCMNDCCSADRREVL